MRSGALAGEVASELPALCEALRGRSADGAGSSALAPAFP
jgi:hypothetical protein